MTLQAHVPSGDLSAMSTSNGEPAAKLLDRQRRLFLQAGAPDARTRRARLAALRRMLDEGEAALTGAVSEDFGGRSPVETRLTDLFLVRAQLELAVKKLGGWMRTRHPTTPLYLWPGSSRIIPQPLGVVGVIGTWNYPIATALAPAICALAAGNRVMVKPSEQAPKTAETLARLIAEHFEPEVFATVLGGPQAAAEFAGLAFDHLVFTGSGGIGRQVAAAAAANLTPVTLELGGKCPAILDAGCDLDGAVGAIAFGKFLNAGQTCVGVDHVLAPAALHGPFVERLKARFAAMFPAWPDAPDFTHIISQRHFERLSDLLKDAVSLGATLVPLAPCGGAAGRAFTPTVILGATPAMRVMREEIFGPILPVLACENADEAIARVNAGDKPLALYWFGRDGAVRDRVLAATFSGGVTVNGAATHLFQRNLAFGGVGASGTGDYLGQTGFKRFSKEKPVFLHGSLNPMALLSPPYSARTERVLACLLRLIQA